MGDSDFSTQNISPTLISQIIDAIKNKAYGSIEIYIQNHEVTQITERTITKLCAEPKYSAKGKITKEYKQESIVS